ncbi:hypothetical protein DESA109040_22735 [Deinococcus saxicola]|uniref:hypothetical protein n=1 Tax=Deinococcus saxicola TaxID=249406 RepID=UPI0039EE1EAB
MTISAFAGASRLSLKAVHLYGELGLLPPQRVNPDSGNRYQLAPASAAGAPDRPVIRTPIERC